MTQQEIIDKQNEYRSVIANFESSILTKQSQMSQYEIDSQEWNQLNDEVLSLEESVMHTKKIIGENIKKIINFKIIYFLMSLLSTLQVS